MLKTGRMKKSILRETLEKLQEIAGEKAPRTSKYNNKLCKSPILQLFNETELIMNEEELGQLV